MKHAGAAFFSSSEHSTRMEASQHPEGPALILAYRLGRMLRAAWAALEAAWRGGAPPPPELERISSAPVRADP